jgi:hypothetical protein
VKHYPGYASSTLRAIQDVPHDFVFLSIAHPNLLVHIAMADCI